MTVARENNDPAARESQAAMAARLEMLVQRRITVDQFEADMVRCCESDPEEVWSLLALLDQFHRLEKLPTELYRALKAAADRYGLVRRGPYIPYVSATPRQVPTIEPATTTAPTPSKAASGAPAETPFRHLLDNTPATAAQPATRDLQGTWQGSRYVQPTPPPRRSRTGLLALTLVMLIAVGAGAAPWLKQRQASGDQQASTGELSRSVSRTATIPAQSPTPPQAPAITPPPAPTAAPAQVPDAGAATVPAAAVIAPTPPVATPSPPTIELAADHYAVPPGDSAARILVRRSGDLRGELDFMWWTENGSAVADTDYVAWGHRTGTIAAGRSSVTLLVPIINDSTRTSPRRFQVVIGPASEGARLGTITRATVQLPGTG